MWLRYRRPTVWLCFRNKCIWGQPCFHLTVNPICAGLLHPLFDCTLKLKGEIQPRGLEYQVTLKKVWLCDFMDDTDEHFLIWGRVGDTDILSSDPRSWALWVKPDSITARLPHLLRQRLSANWFSIPLFHHTFLFLHDTNNKCDCCMFRAAASRRFKLNRRASTCLC